MRERIICRFENEKDLQDFANTNNFNIDKYTKEFNVHTLEKVTKKNITKSKKDQIEYWEEHWFDMPLYESKKQEEYAKIEFIFNEEDLELAEKIFQQKMSDKTTSVWFPKLVSGKHSSLRVIGGNVTHKYPIYVVSKGRSHYCHTSRHLTQMQVHHYVVVEPDDVEDYKKYVGNKYAEILELDMSYKDNYDTFDDLGDTKGKGPGGARNFCWEHSIKNGYKWHWVFDDNAVEGFHWMYKNQKVKCRSGAYFRAIEDFVDRYDNIAIAGLNYSMFCKMCDKTPAFVMNTRIYSFLLIRNDIPYRWRGRYNEDTDLSLRVLKDGWCTIQFNSLLAGKCTTQRIDGGNTEMFYSKEGTYPKSKMLEDMHPDVAKVVWKFNRWHHQVNYKIFTQKLHYSQDYIIPSVKENNNYGMQIIRTEETITQDSKQYLEDKYIYNKEVQDIVIFGDNPVDISCIIDKNKTQVFHVSNILSWHNTLNCNNVIIEYSKKDTEQNFDFVCTDKELQKSINKNMNKCHKCLAVLDGEEFYCEDYSKEYC